MVTISAGWALMLIALLPEFKIEANVPEPSMVSALLMLTAPKPPGSSASISPPAAVFEIAPAKVLQGAVRLQGFASSPTPETQVRVAWACAVDAAPSQMIATSKAIHML